MIKNPYKFIGPLDPVEDEMVCIPRTKEKEKVVRGIINGDYWSILGPRQIGKTTFLRQLMYELSVYYCIYFNFAVSPKEDDKFYEWITHLIIDTIPAEATVEVTEKWEAFGPELNFLNFLEKFQPKENKRIVFFFDDMEKAHCVRSFLHLWRKVFHERYHRHELKKYAVVITGKVDLSSLTIGETSPFNIAQKLELSNFTEIESEELVNEPFEEYNIEFEPEAKEKLISQVSGHPQLMQHLCYILIEPALESEEKRKKSITLEEVDNAIRRIMIENTNLKALEIEIKTNKVLEDLTRQILEGEDKDYMPYRDLSITGTGPIVQNGLYCAIRNKIYEEMMENVIQTLEDEELYVLSPVEKIKEGNANFTTTIYLKEMPRPFSSVEEEIKFLTCLFDINAIKFQIRKDNVLLQKIDLNRTEKLIFCYLSYENYKSNQAGGSPSLRKYHISSVPRNNLKHEPEWIMFVDTMNQEGHISPISKDSLDSDGTIRQAIYSTRKKLENIGAEDLIPRQKPGGGEGYWLKGTVIFALLEMKNRST
jgi:hypothetical protein